ncbi:MAG: hypothetical protein GWN29_04990 [Gammaproteobacteria bacterium]|nr:hypothetical protein [Gammaproteobacteria bacterium]NIV51109.1 hypothetical protein [Gammaproteobacteria bacterium]NIW23962.1 hypothetical protein [Gammaproteobacteria bacterium]NIX85051.1 hypothetical protein [Gammaproteobacteria bacterium]
MGGPGSGRRKATKRVGRPSKFDTKLANNIIRWVEAGNYIETAAAACGVTRATVRAWLREGARAKSGAKAEFLAAFKRAEGIAHAQALARLRSHGSKSWQVDAWFLERRWPHLWGRKDRDGATPSKGEPKINIYVPDNGRVPKKNGGKK